jgi:signal transduction histidine kinase
MLQMVQLNGQRLLELINRLLDFSKLEAGRTTLSRSSVDVNRLITNLVDAATPLAEQRGIILDKQCDPTLPVMHADEEKVDTIISNLLSNALKFTPAGGTVRLETLYDNGRLWVVVSDTGIGIPPEYHERVFERFVQVDGSSSREFSGTGLGLSLAKEFVELHGGGIYLKSEVGKGTQFWFDLPFAACESPEPQPVQKPVTRRLTNRFADLVTYEAANSAPCAAQQPAPAVKAGAAKVLVVDDSPEVRTLMGQILGDHYHVLLARDGAEGIEVALRELPDLIVSDVMMPRVDGHEFCRTVKENSALTGIPFVMLTAKADSSMKVGGLDCGADDYLTKPFDQKELLARVRSLLRMRRLHADLDRRNRELEAAGQRLVSMQNQLVQAEKMSSLGQLVAGLAHEINNAINAVYNGIKPLTVYLRRLEAATHMRDVDVVLAETDPVGELFRKAFSLAEVIENGATRTARIINDLKTFSHPGKEQPEQFDLHKALDMCVNLLSNQIKDRVTIRKEYGDVDQVFGPYGQLNQVFMNILTNAQQAIPEQGEITITTGQHRDRVTVSIRDNGVGMPESVRNRIFDPFFTTKDPGIGTGLGLSLSYGIVSKVGGSIECRSQPGEGTEFIVEFPLVMDGMSAPMLEEVAL